jgi:hypothetical protein
MMPCCVSPYQAHEILLSRNVADYDVGDDVNILTPFPADVVLVRSYYGMHPGNLRFVRHANRLTRAYQLANAKGRDMVAELLVKSVRNRHGNFLRRHPNGGWRLASHQDAMRGAHHTLQQISKKLSILSRRENASDAHNTASTSCHGDRDSITAMRGPLVGTTCNDANYRNMSTRPNGTPAMTTATTFSSKDLQPMSPTTTGHYSLRRCMVLLRQLTMKETSVIPTTFLVQVSPEDNDNMVQAFADSLMCFTRRFQKDDASKPCIASLTLSLHSQLTEAQAKVLSLAVRRCRNLETLCLKFNGAPQRLALLLVAAAIGNTTVTSLLLDGNDLTNTSVAWIRSILYKKSQCSSHSNLKLLSLLNNQVSAQAVVAGNDDESVWNQLELNWQSSKPIC